MNRLHNFKEVVGHSSLMVYIQNKLNTGMFPHFVIIDGVEGLGKTTIADLIALRLAYGEEPDSKIVKAVIDDRKSTDKIKKFVMSVEGGKDAAKNVLAEMHTGFSDVKVIIMDECHAMSEAAQDVFLSDTEYIKDNVYIIMLTTEPLALKPTLRSRAVPIHLMPLTQAEMITILQREVTRKHLKLQGGEHTLQLIAEWAGNKPRTGLSILSAFDENDSVNEDMIREFIGYLSVSDVVQLLQMLSGSMVAGLDYISEMTISDSIVPIVVEVIKIKTGTFSYKVKYADAAYVSRMLETVTTNQLITFLYGITSQPKVTRQLLINSFIRAHYNYETMYEKSGKQILEAEKAQKADKLLTVTPANPQFHAPTLEDLLGSSTIADGGNNES